MAPKRYVIDHEQLKKRRSWEKDDWLNKLVMDQTDAWQKNLSNDLKTKLAQMRLVTYNIKTRTDLFRFVLTFSAY